MTASYVVGQWVRGKRFYGRRALRSAILEGGRAPIWIAGLRRVGKTSLLRQLEDELTRRGAVVLFLDLQGLESAADLERGLVDAWLDGPAATTASPFTEGDSALDGFGAWLDRRTDDVPFWLLIDEADEAATPDALGSGLSAEVGRLVEQVSRLAAPRSGDGNSEGHSRVVLASSLRLADRVAEWRATPSSEPEGLAWLGAFGAPRWIGAMTRAEAEELVRQSQAAADLRPALDDRDVVAICDAAADHPMLLQLVAKRAVELAGVEAACVHLGKERTLEHLFEVDDALLDARERAALRAASRLEGVSRDAVPSRLFELGLVAQLARSAPSANDRVVVRSPFLRDWLRRSAQGSA
jgi:hypothetical protein